VTVNFKPYRLAFTNEGAPALGKKGAPVEVVEFSDFQCPFCQRFAPTLKRVEQEFGDKVYIVYRQYPIPSLHANAIKAAEASLCAHEQGKFWELHDLMFAEQDRLDVTNLKEKARRLGMNQSRFNSCLDSGRYVEQVQKDQQEGARTGMTGTPAVFVNGIEIPGGAVSYEVVREAIQKELTRSQRSN
jgi:protein-disulfide isomerase